MPQLSITNDELTSAILVPLTPPSQFPPTYGDADDASTQGARLCTMLVGRSCRPADVFPVASRRRTLAQWQVIFLAERAICRPLLFCRN